MRTPTPRRRVAWTPFAILTVALGVFLACRATARQVPFPPLPSLYFIEDVSSSDVVRKRSLVRVTWNERSAPTRETLLVADQRFFGHFGGHRLEQGRFVVTHFGGVIDGWTGKILHEEEDGDLLGVEDGKVVVRITNLDRKRGIFSFDLSRRAVEDLGSGTHWDLPGVVSPDRTTSVRQDDDKTIRLYRLGRPPVDLVEGFQVDYSPKASTLEGTPCLWLDAQRILTAQSNRRLAIITVEGVVESFVNVGSVPLDVSSPPRLSRDAAGRVLYECGGAEYVIDADAGSAVPLERYALGNAFEASVAVDGARRRTVYHEGSSIGRWTFNPSDVATAPGALALSSMTDDADPRWGRPTRIACWTRREGGWRTIEAQVNDLIGWSD